MQFDYSPKVQQLRERVDSFMQQHVYPNEQRFYEEIEENTQARRALDSDHAHRRVEAEGTSRWIVESVSSRSLRMARG